MNFRIKASDSRSIGLMVARQRCYVFIGHTHGHVLCAHGARYCAAVRRVSLFASTALSHLRSCNASVSMVTTPASIHRALFSEMSAVH